MTTGRIRDALKRLLNIPPSATMEYKTHNDCLKYDLSLDQYRTQLTQQQQQQQQIK